MKKIDCEFTFVCDKEWYELSPLKENESYDLGIFSEARFCISCKKNVFKVEAEEQVKLAINDGHCVCIGKFDKKKMKWINRAFQNSRTMGMLSPPSKSIEGKK
jgi:hypothetical protein